MEKTQARALACQAFSLQKRHGSAGSALFPSFAGNGEMFRKVSARRHMIFTKAGDNRTTARGKPKTCICKQHP
ncbi:hypothetical protein D1841_02140 [Neglecta sp. X4]|nr:hypothetical protein [Neglectibacter sp. 59]NBJ72153.1 hypothetical protein [Neglectibacter sp. X4]NCE80095.1 hypothetical protein [Neglectibacter sp. X58]